MADFSSEVLEARGSRMTYLKELEKNNPVKQEFYMQQNYLSEIKEKC